MVSKPHFAQVKLYVLLTQSMAKRPLEEVARAVLEAGAQAVQLREKAGPDGELLARAQRLKRLTERFGALLIVNDRADIAVLSGADGVHLGQDDLPPDEVRRVVGDDLLIGFSTHNEEQVRGARMTSADYIGVGPTFATATKGYDAGLGPERIGRLAAAATVPTVAIGGITIENVQAVMATGVQAVAVCSGIICAEDPGAATKRFLELISRNSGS